jgi:hypothetical protein
MGKKTANKNTNETEHHQERTVCEIVNGSLRMEHSAEIQDNDDNDTDVKQIQDNDDKDKNKDKNETSMNQAQSQNTPPKPATSFEEMGVDQFLIDSLAQLSIREPTEIQAMCIKPTLEGE